MDLKKKHKDDIQKKLFYYNAFSCLYIPLTVLCSICIGNLYDIGNLSWYYPTVLFLGEITKSYYLLNNSSKYFKIFSRKELCKSGILCVVSIILFDILEVCAGAPFFEKQDKTLSLAIILTLLSVFSSCLLLGYEETVELFLNISSYNGDLIGRMVLINVCSTTVGAWLGAIVIPLDWDRPWQDWPIPCSFGALIGNVFGNLIYIILPRHSKTLRHTFVKP